MYQHTNYWKKFGPKPVLMLLLLGILASLLAACGEANIGQPTAPSSNPANPTSSPTPASTQKASDEDSNPTAPVMATTVAASNTAGGSKTSASSSRPDTTPIIAFSDIGVVEIGHSMTVSGSGFPSQTQLVLVIGPNGNQLAGPYAMPVTDAQGRFSVSLTFGAGHINLNPGTYLIKVNVKNDPNTGASGFFDVATDVHNPAPTAKPVPPSQNTTTLSSPSSRAVAGEQIRLDGFGYKPNTTVHIKGGIQNLGKDYGAVPVDQQGLFTINVTISNDLGNYTGPYHFATDYPGDKASFTLNIVTKSNFEPQIGTGPAQEVHEGQPFTLSGHNFPPNSQVKLSGGVQNPGNDFGTVTTDAEGTFTKVITISGLDGYKGVYYINADWNSVTDVRATVTVF